MDELAQFERALKGIDFPTSQATIVNRVHELRSVDPLIVELAGQLPRRVYDWERDASREFARLLGADLAPWSAGAYPAAR